jgi:hypothetical protein
MLLIQNYFLFSAISAVFVLTNNLVPSRKLGKVNGISMMVGSIFKGLGP